MAPYDSDSSEDEGQSFTETNVLLGYASKEAGGETVSRLGGEPVSSHPSHHFTRQPFRAQLPNLLTSFLLSK